MRASFILRSYSAHATMDTKSDLKQKRVIVIACKRPVPGRVKTRLARSVGEERASALYGAFLGDTVENARAVPSCSLVLSYAISDDEEQDRLFFEGSFSGAESWPQVEGNLGTRIVAIFQQAASEGYAEVLLVGSDAPHLRAKEYARALDRVSSEGRVIGPTDDGGFWCVGLRSPEPELFSGVEWSTERTLEQVQSNAEVSGEPFALLPRTFDVDDAEGLNELKRWIAENGAASCPRTEALLR